MLHSLDLLKKLQRHSPDKSERALALELGYSDTAFQSAKTRGNLSAEMAADVAMHVGEDPTRWALIAAAEGARHPAIKRRLNALVRSMSAPQARTAWTPELTREIPGK